MLYNFPMKRRQQQGKGKKNENLFALFFSYTHIYARATFPYPLFFLLYSRFGFLYVFWYINGVYCIFHQDQKQHNINFHLPVGSVFWNVLFQFSLAHTTQERKKKRKTNQKENVYRILYTKPFAFKSFLRYTLLDPEDYCVLYV